MTHNLESVPNMSTNQNNEESSIDINYRNKSWANVLIKLKIGYVCSPAICVAFALVILTSGSSWKFHLIMFFPPIIMFILFMIIAYPLKIVEISSNDVGLIIQTTNPFFPITIKSTYSKKKKLSTIYYQDEELMYFEQNGSLMEKRLSLNGMKKEDLRELIKYLKSQDNIEIE